MNYLTKDSLADVQSWIDAARTEGAVALIDKDTDWTSFDVVGKLRNTFHIKKVGHAGTLDPNATGLLILCFGKATKKVNEYQAQTKHYHATIKFGATTKTDDAEAEEENITETDKLCIDDVLETMQSFIGNIEQIPPMFSAIKVKGQRLYKLARKNQVIEVDPRQVQVESIEITKADLPVVEADIVCSKGTYIRAIARDWGKALAVGGYLLGLRRTAIGQYSVDNAVTIDEILSKLKEIDIDGTQKQA